MRTEADDSILAVELLGKQLKDALEVAHPDVLVDNQTFDLMEQGRVRGVYRVRAVNAAGRNDADRRLLLLHRAYLHGRCLGTQDDVIRNIEGILRVARRMILRDVQSLKVVVVKLNLGTLSDREAQTKEDFLEFIEHDVQRMLFADRQRLAGHGHVQRFPCELGFERLAFDFLALRGQRGLELGADVVDELAHCRTILGRNIA